MMIETAPTPIRSKALARLATQILISMGITFLLFAGMSALIERDDELQPPTSAPVLVSSIFQEPEEVTTTRTKIKPPPTLPEVPQLELVEPTDVIPTEITTQSRIALPRFKVDNTFSMQNSSSDMRPLVRQTPKYPPKAARDGVEGYVVLSFSISTTGQAINIEIVDAQPKGIFEREARKALKRWKYQPQLMDGKPVEVHHQQVQLDFKLDSE